MKRQTIRFTYYSSLAFIAMSFFMNCGVPMSQSTKTVSQSSVAPIGELSPGSSEQTKAVNEESLISGEQIFASMVSLTGIPASNADVSKRFSDSKDTFAGSFDLDDATAPMLVAVQNLAGEFCDEILVKEVPLASDAAAAKQTPPAAGKRRFFGSIDFTKAPKDIAIDDYKKSLAQMAKIFWGRYSVKDDVAEMLSSDELSSILSARLTYLNAAADDKDAADVKVIKSTRSMMLFTCTAMLSSFDSITL